VPADGLANKLQLGRPLKIKLGVDPTRPDLTLGHAIVLRKLRQFQDAGHHVILVIGDFTASIGDPSGMDKTRPMLERSQIVENAQTYVEQAGKILDIPNCDIKWNSEWSNITFETVIGLARQFTVAQFLERDDFAKRFKEKRPIGIHELLYPLAQGFDSWYLEADVELGGSDQLFNIMVGRTLQAKLKNALKDDPQVCMTMPLLVGTDGVRKMSKSLNNHIALTDTPNDMFGKTMSIPDHLIWPWWNTLYDDSLHGGGITQVGCERDCFMYKKALAHEIVREFHSLEAAGVAQAQWNSQFSSRNVPDDIKEVPFSQIEGKNFIDIVAHLFNESKSQARRLITDGAVKLNFIKTTDTNHVVNSGIIKVGKRRYIKVTDGGHN